MPAHGQPAHGFIQNKCKYQYWIAVYVANEKPVPQWSVPFAFSYSSLDCYMSSRGRQQHTHIMIVTGVFPPAAAALGTFEM